MIRHPGLFFPLVFMSTAAWLSYEWLGFFMFFTVPLLFFLSRGWVSVTKWIMSFSFLLGLLLGWEGFQTREMRFAFVGLAVAFSASLWRAWVERRLSFSYMDHRLKWFEGGPRVHSRVHCEVEGWGPCRIARLDRVGTFLFPISGPVQSRPKRLRIRLEDDLGVTEIQSKITRLDQGGVGAKFVYTSMDQRKKIGDLVERFQGAGNEA